MKTAMQELMDKIELQIEEEKIEGKFGIGIWGLHQAKNLVIDMLEKEKEQIINAHIEGQRVFDEYQHTQWTNEQAEHYYNQTYNQDRKLPTDVKNILDNL